MSGCFDDNTLAAMIDGSVAAGDRAALNGHLDSCESCRELLASALRAEEIDAAPGPSVRLPGARLGRYVVLETIGSGAMGVVYAAFDPQLGRKVALKLLRIDPSELGDSNDPDNNSPAGRSPPSGRARSGKARLLREAQTLARLSHANVVAIHDVGTIDGELFLTMEFVEGGTLGDWLHREERSWRAVADLMRQVGEGLGAAHEAGLVHRDLKPENILVGSGDRARVTDFGLARRAHDPSLLSSPMGPLAPAAQSDLRLTKTGAMMGTPAYMAPEQLAGGLADALSDQFSFAVTFYEALYGERPFEGTQVKSLSEAIARGAVRPPPAQSKVPAWLRRVVVRGLAADPAQRYPSMRAMLRALAAGPPFSLQRVSLLALLLALVALAVWEARPSAPVCNGADAAWGFAWDAARANEVRLAFIRTGRPQALIAANEVARVLDDERARWRDMYKEACEATRVRGEQSESLLDARMRCLAERRGELKALAGVLSEASGEMVDRSVSAALSLPGLDSCNNLRALSTQIPPPSSPEARARFDAVSEKLARAAALEYAGQYPQGIEELSPALEEARLRGFTGLSARLLLVQAQLTNGEHQFVKAEGLFHDAAAAAQESRDDGTSADAWTALIRLVGFSRARPAESHIWARYAQGAIERIGGDDEREAIRLRTLATVVWRLEGKFDEAEGLIERARALFEKHHGPRYDFQIAGCDESRAGIDFDLGQPAEALLLHQKSAAVRERLFGEAHPSLAVSYVNQGEDLVALGKPDEAIPLILRAIAMVNSANNRGADAYYRHRLAAAYRAKSDFTAALAEDQRSLEATAASGEAGGYWESWAKTGLGEDLLALGRAREAVAPLETAVQERAEATPAEQAESRFALARALWESGDKERARSEAEAAREKLKLPAVRYGGPFAKSREEIAAWLAARQ